MTVKTCPKCGEEKPTSEFGKNAQKPDGLQYRCRSCTSEYNGEYYERTKERLQPGRAKRRDQVRADLQRKFLDLLDGKSCVDCGHDDTRVLEFDHLRDKEDGIGTMISKGRKWEDIEAEMAKCELVCVNCHRLRTLYRMGSYRITGV